MRLPTRITVIAVLILGVVLSLAGSTASGAPAQTTATPMATDAPTAEATQDQPGQDQQGQQQGQPLDWQNIPLCLDVIATPDAAQGITQDQSAVQAQTGDQTQQQSQQQDQSAQATATATLDPMSTPFLGVLVGPVSNCGVRVIDIFPGSPAQTAELLVDDVIVAVDDVLLAEHASALFAGISLGTRDQVQGAQATAMATQDQGQPAQPQGQQTQQQAQTRLGQFHGFNAAPTAAFFHLVRSRMPGETLTLIVQRNNANQQVTVTLGTLPQGFLGTGDGEDQQNQTGQGQQGQQGQNVTATPTPGS